MSHHMDSQGSFALPLAAKEKLALGKKLGMLINTSLLLGDHVK